MCELAYFIVILVIMTVTYVSTYLRVVELEKVIVDLMLDLHTEEVNIMLDEIDVLQK